MQKQSKMYLLLPLVGLILTAVLVYFVSIYHKWDIACIEIDTQISKDSIYLHLQSNYDNYLNNSVSKTAIDSENWVEIYLASRKHNNHERIDYLYYCPTLEENVNVRFLLYRTGELIATYQVTTETLGVLSFENTELLEDDLLIIEISKDGIKEESTLELDYYYNRRINKH